MAHAAFSRQFAVFALARGTEVAANGEAVRSTALLEMTHAHRGLLVLGAVRRRCRGRRYVRVRSGVRSILGKAHAHQGRFEFIERWQRSRVYL